MFTSGPLERRLILAILLAAGSLAALSCEMPLELEGPPPPGPTATCFDYGQQLRIESFVNIPWSATDLLVMGDCAYVAAGGRLLFVELDSTGRAEEFKEAGIRAEHLASAREALCVTSFMTLTMVDATPHRRGKVMAEMTLPFSIWGLASDGNYAYLLSPLMGLWIVDVRDPAAPRIVGSVDIPTNGRTLAVRGNLACVISENDLWVIDVTDRSSPHRIGQLSLEQRMNSVAMVDRFAVVSADLEIVLVDLSNPSVPEVTLSSALANMFVRSMVFAGSRAYLCGRDLVMVDLTRPTSPVIAGRLAEVEADAVAVDGDRIFISGRHGLMVATLPGDRRPAPLMVVNTQRGAFRTALRSPIAFVTGGLWGLWVVAIEESPGVVGRLSIRGSAIDVACDSTYAYVAAGDMGLVVVEASLALAPRVVSELPLPGELAAIAVEDHLAYIALSDLGLWIADVSDPLSPRVVGSLDTAEARDIVVRDGRAWIADAEGLVAADVTDPERPRTIATIAIPEATALALARDHAYVVTSAGRLQLIDIATPENLELAGSLEIPSVMLDVATDGTIAYLATMMGLMVADVSDPMAPALIGMAADERTFGVLWDEASDRVFVANGNLTEIRPQCDDSARGVWP